MSRRITCALLGILFVVLSATLVVPVLATRVIAYSTPLYVSNNSSTGYTNLPLAASVNNSMMAALGFMGAQGLDTRMLLGGVALPEMVCDNKTMFVLPTCAISSQTNLSYTTGNSDVTEFSTILGLGGYYTVPNSSSLNVTNNWTMSWNGGINDNTDSIIFKSGSYKLKRASGNVTFNTSTMGVYPIISSNSSGYQSANGVVGIPVTMPSGIASGDLLIAQMGTRLNGATINTPLGWISLANTTNYSSSTGSYAVFYKIATGSETTTNFTTSVATLSAWQTFRITNYTGIPVVGTTSTGSSTNADPPNNVTGFGTVATLFIAGCANVGADVTAAPSGYSYLIDTSGNAVVASATKYAVAVSDDPGTFTNASMQWAAQTIAIQVGSGADTPIVSVIAPSGYVIINVYEDGVHIWVTVNGAVSANASSVTLITNTSPILVCSSATPYMTSFKITKGGTLAGWWQPNSMIIGNNLPDRSGNSNNGTITWGNNPANINLTWGTMTSSSSVSASPTTAVPVENLPAAPVSNWFGAPNLTKLASNPVRPFVLIISNNVNLPEATAWQWLGLAFVLFCTMATAVGLKGHLMIAGFAAAASIGTLTAMTIWPFWSLVFAVMAIVGGVIAERLPWV